MVENLDDRETTQFISDSIKKSVPSPILTDNLEFKVNDSAQDLTQSFRKFIMSPIKPRFVHVTNQKNILSYQEN